MSRFAFVFTALLGVTALAQDGGAAQASKAPADPCAAQVQVLERTKAIQPGPLMSPELVAAQVTTAEEGLAACQKRAALTEQRSAEFRAGIDAIKADRARHEAELAAARKDRESIQLAQSLRLCHATARRKEALADIADQKEASKLAGTVSLSDLHEAQTVAHEAGKSIKSAQAALRAAGMKPVPCKDLVLGTHCFGDPEADPRCKEHERIRTITALAHELAGE